MMDQDIVNKALDDAKFVKIIASTVFFWATIFGISARQGIANILKSVARRGTASMKAMANAILGKKELLDKLEAQEGNIDVDEAVDNHTFFRADNASRVRFDAKDVQGRKEKVNESVDVTARFKKLANIKG